MKKILIGALVFIVLLTATVICSILAYQKDQPRKYVSIDGKVTKIYQQKDTAHLFIINDSKTLSVDRSADLANQLGGTTKAFNGNYDHSISVGDEVHGYVYYDTKSREGYRLYTLEPKNTWLAKKH